MTQRHCSARQPILVGQGNVLQQDLGCTHSTHLEQAEAGICMLGNGFCRHLINTAMQHHHVTLQDCKAWGPGLTLCQVSQSLFPPLISPPDCTQQRKEHLQTHTHITLAASELHYNFQAQLAWQPAHSQRLTVRPTMKLATDQSMDCVRPCSMYVKKNTEMMVMRVDQTLSHP